MERLKNVIGGEATIEIREAGEINAREDKLEEKGDERQGKVKGDGGRRRRKMG